MIMEERKLEKNGVGVFGARISRVSGDGRQ